MSIQDPQILYCLLVFVVLRVLRRIRRYRLPNPLLLVNVLIICGEITRSDLELIPGRSIGQPGLPMWYSERIRLVPQREDTYLELYKHKG